MDSNFSRSVASIVFASGAIWAQVDTSSARKDSVAPPVAPIVVDSHKVVAPVADTAKPVQADSSAKVAASIPVAPVDTVKVPAKASDSAVACHCKGRWSLEVGAGYDWFFGELVDQEDRLTKYFNVFLKDESGDSSMVDPIGSGIGAKAVLWRKLAAGNQIGLGLGFGSYREHPASSYSSSLTEDFFTELQASLRYRHVFAFSSSLEGRAEVAAGWNRLSLMRTPLVAAHRNDASILLSSDKKQQVQELHRQVAANGIRGEALLGIGYRLAPEWSLGFQAGAAYGQIWLSETTATDAAVDYPDQVGFWSLGLGLSIARDF